MDPAGQKKPALHLEELARACFEDVEHIRANSWVRNSLRRLLRDSLVERSDRGAYHATASGMERLRGQPSSGNGHS